MVLWLSLGAMIALVALAKSSPCRREAAKMTTTIF